MPKKVKLSPKASVELERLYDYITANWGEGAAKNILEEIKTDIYKLEQYPLLGFDLGKKIDIPTDYRCLYSERNYVIYRLKLDTTHIVRILNEQQNYMERLFGINSDDTK